jgi:uncharacterized protein (TIGR03083 family)
MTDWGALYREHVAAVASLARDLPDDRLATPVPATPAWTVRHVVAHLAGVASDNVTGRTDDAPGPAWTARHVGERVHLPVEDVVAELEGHADAVVATTVDNPRPAIVWDIAVHHTDLHEALGLGRLPERLWQPVVEAVGPWRAPDLVGSVPSYELFRACFSRRSQDQLRALGLDEVTAADIGVFGPRDDDQPVPAA